MDISVIIPVFNEEEFIFSTIREIRKRASNSRRLQIIVVDGGSTDGTVLEAKKAGVKIIRSFQKRRSVQLNEGAKAATADILYFLHADTKPPQNFDTLIYKSIEKGNTAGCFRLSFDHPHFLLRFYARCTWLDVDAFRYGDQSLFISQKMFDRIGGYRNDHIHMEDHEIVKRIKTAGQSFTILPALVTTSSRKYLANGMFRLQALYILIFVLYKAGLKQSTLHLLYLKLVH